MTEGRDTKKDLFIGGAALILATAGAPAVVAAAAGTLAAVGWNRVAASSQRRAERAMAAVPTYRRQECGQRPYPVDVRAPSTTTGRSRAEPGRAVCCDRLVVVRLAICRDRQCGALVARVERFDGRPTALSSLHLSTGSRPAHSSTRASSTSRSRGSLFPPAAPEEVSQG